MELEAVNRMTREAFVDTLGGVFERSPWVAERAWGARPFKNAASLHRAMVDAVKSATPAEQLGLLRAHPQLAGREAREGRMTDDSVTEQSSAGLDRLSDEELDRFNALNASYANKFGFPFIVAVSGRSRKAILSAFERRLRNNGDAETAAALDEVFSIAALRLGRLLGRPLQP